MKEQDIFTLKDAKQYLRERIVDEPTTCPCCERATKVYKRSISSTMAKGLYHFYNAKKQKYAHAMRLFRTILDEKQAAAQTNFALFRYWGIVQHHPEDRGVYKITSIDKSFLLKRLPVPKYIQTYNKQLLGTSEEMTIFQECLDEPLDLNKIIKETARF